jgi:FtsH-binding integral membrane protein
MNTDPVGPSSAGGNTPPIPKVLDYPGMMTIIFGVTFVAVLLFVSGKFDPTGGTLTISLLVVVAFLGLVAFSVFFTVPTDEVTSAVIGGLVAAFGGVIAYWLSRGKNNGSH